MQINLNTINTDQFKIKEGQLFNLPCFLITPALSGVDWQQENLHFRSLIVDENGNIISCGFKKFFNALEKPAIDPWNSNWDCFSHEKLDGSLLIISNWRGKIIHRTRGTFNAEFLQNGGEIAFLKDKYPNVFNHPLEDISMFYEWQTPSRKIVLEPPSEPTLTLIGGIKHDTLQYLRNFELRNYNEYVKTGRPKKYYYSNLVEALNDVKFWEGKEGIVISSPDGQIFKKIKSDQYLKLHYFLTQLNDNGIIELICQNGWCARKEFYKIIEDQTDFETFIFVKGLIDKIYDIVEDLEKEKEKVALDVSQMIGTRKDLACIILSKYYDWRKAFAFKVLDGCFKIDNRTIKKIIKDKLNENSNNS